MEASSVEVLRMLATVLTISSYGLLSAYKRHKARKYKRFLFLVQDKSAITPALNKVRDDLNNDVLVIDLNDDVLKKMTEEQKELLEKLHGEERALYVFEMLDNILNKRVQLHKKYLKNKVVVLISNNIEVLKILHILKVNPKCVMSLLPTIKFYHHMKKDPKHNNNIDFDKIDEQREKLINLENIPCVKYNKVETLEEIFRKYLSKN